MRGQSALGCRMAHVIGEYLVKHTIPFLSPAGVFLEYFVASKATRNLVFSHSFPTKNPALVLGDVLINKKNDKSDYSVSWKRLDALTSDSFNSFFCPRNFGFSRRNGTTERIEPGSLGRDGLNHGHEKSLLHP